MLQTSDNILINIYDKNEAGLSQFRLPFVPPIGSFIKFNTTTDIKEMYEGKVIGIDIDLCSPTEPIINLIIDGRFL